MSSQLSQLEKRLIEACDELWDSFVDPREPFYDGDGDGHSTCTQWLALADGRHEHSLGSGVASEQDLRAIRTNCRTLAATNEFAINGHENRISYIVGSGHTYRAAVKKHHSAPASLAAEVQAEIEEFIAANHWQRRQQEIVRRKDRDGEAFLRFFVAPDGTLRVRFVEPGLVATPLEWASVPAASFGVLSQAHDVESVLAYFIEGEQVDAGAIQHRKANVDGNVKRGLPLFYPVAKNLKRAEKLLRNMSVLAEIQSAVALIRKHQRGTKASVQQFVSDHADQSVTNPTTGRTTHYRRFGPGTILDAFGNVDYDFPAAFVNAAGYVGVLQAELRAIASRLVMPEFMLTSDASNANYASTLVAEGPALKFFQRLQAEQIEEDLAVMWRVVQTAVTAGRLPRAALSQIDILATPPSLAVRDHLKEAQVYKIEHASGILSPQTWSQLRGLDYEQEQANLAEHGGK